MSGNSNADIWIAGAGAAFTVDLLVYPLDTLKTRMQSPDYKRLYTYGAQNALNRSMFRGLYQGVGSVIVATLPSSGAFFTTYEGTKSVLSDSKAAQILPQPVIHSAASATAELLSCAILTPAEVIKQNAQMVDNSKSSGVKVNATLATMKRFRSNPLALWRGYTALAGRNLPFTALQFPMFERIKEMVKQYRDEKGTRTNTLLESGLITAASAGAAGSIAAVVTTPVDVVKTRIMLTAVESAAENQKPGKQGTSGSTSAMLNDLVKSIQSAKKSNESAEESIQSAKESTQSTKMSIQPGKESITNAVKTLAQPPSRKGSMQIAREIMAESGVKGLFRGGALRAVWTMLGSGIYLGVYESGRVYLARRRGENVNEEDL